MAANPRGSALLAGLQADLDALSRTGSRRVRRTCASPCGPHPVVGGRPLVAFASNDYLGLAADPALAAAAIAGVERWGVGAGASHLVSGHYTPHEALEQRLADFVGMQRALFFSTGYLANTGVIPALVSRGDTVFADRLNHASLVDGALLSRASLHRYPHGDATALAALLARHPAPRRLIVTDTVFSMDGDIAPLAELLELARRFDAWLMVDDAHGFGVLGPQGRGALAHLGLADERLIYVGTLGKAAGVAGAFVAGAATLVDWLVQKARSYIFTTASPPLIACALLAAVDAIEAGDGRRAHLFGLIERLHQRLRLRRWRRLPSTTAIHPVVIGSNEETLAASARLADEGLWVPAIRPPTVPAGSSRLRVSLSAAHTAADVDRLADALCRAEAAA